MISWMIAWVWWLVWRIVITIVSVLTIQQIIHEEDGVWIETKPLFIGAILLVLLIRIWSMAGHSKEQPCHKVSSTGSSGFSGPT